MIRIDYLRWPDWKLLGYAVCVKLPDPPQDPRISKIGWPDPAGQWVYYEVDTANGSS